MIRLVRRNLGGGWMTAINSVTKLGETAGKTIGNIVSQREHDRQQREIAAMNMQQAQAERETAEWRAKAAIAAGQYDRNSNSAVMTAINNGIRTIPYNNGAITPGYMAAAQPQTNSSVTNSGMLSGVVSSFFKGNNSSDDNDGGVESQPYPGTEEEYKDHLKQKQLEEQEKLRKDSKDYSSTGNAVDQTLSGDIQTNTQERPPITEKAQSSVETKPNGAGGNIESDTEAAKHQEKKDNSSVKLQSAESGCRLKKRFNPREFKRKK